LVRLAVEASFIQKSQRAKVPSAYFNQLPSATGPRPLMADFVAKRFWASERARLIQDQAPIRNVDSKIHSP
jgi:hypothetical protein